MINTRVLFWVAAIAGLSVLLLWWESEPPVKIPAELQCLWVAYPEFRIDPQGEKIIFDDGTEMPFIDKLQLDPLEEFDEIEQNVTSLAQMFGIPYRKGFDRSQDGQRIVRVPERNEDPGRLRYEPFFKKLYGATEAAVVPELVTVDWLIDGTKLQFHRKFGAAQALTNVARDLNELVKVRPELRAFLVSPLGGTFAWRPIAGSRNQSLHSYAIAIDINLDKTDYWRWNLNKDNNELHYRNRIPVEIVEVFEHHGFIWGGKWSHYDTMHFEYRPELLMQSQDCERQFLELYGNRK